MNFPKNGFGLDFFRIRVFAKMLKWLANGLLASWDDTQTDYLYFYRLLRSHSTSLLETNILVVRARALVGANTFGLNVFCNLLTLVI